MTHASYRSVFRDGIFAKQTIIVTGGGSGIGRCTAHELAALGASVALVGRKEAKLNAVAAEIHATLATQGEPRRATDVTPHRATDVTPRVTTHACDIRDEDAVRDMVAAVLAAHGRIDALVNNAGGQYPATLATISAKGWDAVVRTNLTGGFLVARECYTQWMKAHGGAVVNVIADMWHGMPGMGHSGAARAGMLNLTETASLEWAPVRVNAVAPGWIASSGMDSYPADIGAWIRSLPQRVPLRRLGTESEVAAAITFLLSPAAAFISGTCLRIDGAAPNAKRVWDAVGTGGSTEAFDGFHLAAQPKVLAEPPPAPK